MSKHARSILADFQDIDESRQSFCDSFLLLFSLYFGFYGLDTKSLNRFTRSYASLLDYCRSRSVDQLVSDGKAFTVYWSAVAYRDQMPLPPRPAPLFRGIWMTWMIRLIGRQAHLSFFVSLFQLKRGWPSLSAVSQLAAFEKHAQILSSAPQELSPAAARAIHLAAQVFCIPASEAERPSIRLRGLSQIHVEPEALTRLLPSARAAHGHPIKSGGPRVAYSRAIVGGGEAFRAQSLRAEVLPRGVSAVMAASAYRARVWDIASSEALSPQYAKVIALAEPAKWRMITAMEMHNSTASQPEQSLMLSLLKRSPLFTVSTSTESDLDTRIAYFASRLVYADDLLLVSGDYSAATDKLNIHATTGAYKSVARTLGFSRERTAAGLHQLGGVTLDYSSARSLRAKLVRAGSLPESHPVLEDVKQKTGQLMGGFRSFPLLNIANLATFILANPPAWQQFLLWVRRKVHSSKLFSSRARERFVENFGFCDPAWSESRRYWYFSKFQPAALRELRTLAVLLNGDDILLVLDREGVQRWKEGAAALGFELSPGKTIVSRSSCSINSVVYAVNPRSVQLVSRVGYLNLKLVWGSSLKAGHSEAYQIEVGAAVGRMIQGAPWTAPVLASAMSKYKSALPGANWFVPVALGGCGVPPSLAHGKIVLTAWQRKMAWAALNDPRLSIKMKREDYWVAPLLPRAKLVDLRQGGRFVLEAGGKRLLVGHVKEEVILPDAAPEEPFAFGLNHTTDFVDDGLRFVADAIDLTERESRYSAYVGQILGIGQLLVQSDFEPSAERPSVDVSRWVRAAGKTRPPVEYDPFDEFSPYVHLYPMVAPLPQPFSTARRR